SESTNSRSSAWASRRPMADLPEPIGPTRKMLCMSGRDGVLRGWQCSPTGRKGQWWCEKREAGARPASHQQLPTLGLRIDSAICIISREPEGTYCSGRRGIDICHIAGQSFEFEGLRLGSFRSSDTCTSRYPYIKPLIVV